MAECCCRKTVKLRNVVLGSGSLALIMPIAAKDTEEVVSLAKEFEAYDPDILEWRVDYFDEVENIPILLEAAKALRETVGDRAVMATPRHKEENGVREIKPEKKKEILLALIRSGVIDMVDVEMRYGEAYIRSLQEECQKYGVALMVSYHDLQHTPDSAEIISLLKKEVELGADVCKVSFVAETYGDNDRLGKAIAEARTAGVDAPIVSISAGPKGTLSRICGDVFGSDGTFVSTGKTHQIHIDDVRALRKSLKLDH
ncbi:type I 3-dehydroquinate dehydratase [Hominifimenecus sp. rT4P-3]|uniref:type I 3-dehydroquinate dehydratase n=1 Tax=Hominifimenecus sp. rT4P-3 TaxID=3242979 RepID=UPI003DA4C1D0